MDARERYQLPNLNGEEVELLLEALRLNEVLLRERSLSCYLVREAQLALARKSVMCCEVRNTLLIGLKAHGVFDGGGGPG